MAEQLRSCDWFDQEKSQWRGGRLHAWGVLQAGNRFIGLVEDDRRGTMHQVDFTQVRFTIPGNEDKR